MNFRSLLIVPALLMLLTAAQAQQVYRGVRLLSQGPDGILLRFDMDELRFRTVQTEKGEALIPHFEGGTPLLMAGAPDLPKIAALLQVPGDQEFVIEVVDARYEDLRGLDIAPSKGNLLRTVDPAGVPYVWGDAYAKAGFFPAAPVSLRPVFRQRELHGLPVWIQPLQYDAASRTLRQYRSMTIRIRPVSGEFQVPSVKVGRTFDELFAKLYPNYEASGSSGPESMDRLLVVAPDAWVETLAPFLEWKRQTGIHTRFLPLSLAGGGDPTTLQETIRDKYATDGVTHVLLVGDEQRIGTIMRPSGGGSYSCDNCFGYLDEEDHIQDILVGRLHAADERQLAVMLQRILRYEKSPSMEPEANWFATGMASASEEGEGFGDDGQADYQHANEWKGKYLEKGFGTYWEFYDGDHGDQSPTPGDPSADQVGNPVSDSLVARMNNGGVSIYNYTGHGWEQGLASGNFSTTSVAALRNDGAYPILIAVACCTGNFTNGECLGEAWQRAGDTVAIEPWGGIAGFFSSDFQSWSPPMEGQDAMNRYLTEADGIELFPSIGGMAAYGNALMIAAYGEGGEVMADFWNPFADPTTLPRNAWPDTLAASWPDSTILGATQLQVACAVEGAKVGLYQKGQTLAVAHVLNGQAQLTFPPLNDPEPIVVTVTQFNHLPIQGQIPVGTVPGPFLACRGVKVDDAQGNGNALVDYGESFHLDLEMSNFGGSGIDSANLQLVALHPGVSIAKDTFQIGGLAAGSDLSLDDAFHLLAADDLPHGTELPFRILFRYGQDTGRCDLTFLVQAPDLDIETLTWLDSLGSGNGNRRLEEGEGAAFTFLYRNGGGSNSPDLEMEVTTDSPWITFSGPQAKGPIDHGTHSAVTFTAEVGTNVPAYTPFHVTLHIGAGAYGTERTFGPFWLEPIVEDFESQGWDAFSWQDSLGHPWVIVEEKPWNGQYCAQSDDIADLEVSEMSITVDVEQDGFVGFARRVSSEAGWDFLRFYIDGEKKAEWTGELPWAEFQFPVTTGVHVFSWRYEKDEIISEGMDLAWVDEIYLPLSSGTVATGDVLPAAGRLLVSPNPTAGPVRVKWTDAASATCRLEVWNASGSPVWGRDLDTLGSAGSMPLDLSGLPPGWYLLRVIEAGQVSTVPLLLQR